MQYNHITEKDTSKISTLLEPKGIRDFVEILFGEVVVTVLCVVPLFGIVALGGGGFTTALRCKSFDLFAGGGGGLEFTRVILSFCITTGCFGLLAFTPCDTELLIEICVSVLL